ncbi:hypothetical protein CesoFtcFv8_012719 [Champsocephalus esox]|uniref:Uncharacterized protein n=2 Tax=Champsocephalus TaxID=52236 RepID=A0AAN8DFN6_CHAGU|nr:hypothetical protein CesoFtcFv8_012719 [Champsocephalus esox]KAK5922272.1 hypothetical protein CgunFtcFv8_019549 [Champsocephalus gunnari]
MPKGRFGDGSTHSHIIKLKQCKPFHGSSNSFPADRTVSCQVEDRPLSWTPYRPHTVLWRAQKQQFPAFAGMFESRCLVG